MQRQAARCRDSVWHGEVVAAVAEQVASHSRVVEKNQEGHLGSKCSQLQVRPHSPGFQCQEDKSP